MKNQKYAEINIDSLFESVSEDSENFPQISGNDRINGNSVARCACGARFRCTIPTKCACGATKPYWQDFHGKILKLSDMDLGYLRNIISLMSEKLKESPNRRDLEIAIDLVYEEIAAPHREKQLTQLAGLARALKVG